MLIARPRKRPLYLSVVDTSKKQLITLFFPVGSKHFTMELYFTQLIFLISERFAAKTHSLMYLKEIMHMSGSLSLQFLVIVYAGGHPSLHNL